MRVLAFGLAVLAAIELIFMVFANYQPDRFTVCLNSAGNLFWLISMATKEQ